LTSLVEQTKPSTSTSAIVATLNHNMATPELGQYDGTTLHITDDEECAIVATINHNMATRALGDYCTTLYDTANEESVEIFQGYEARARVLANDPDSADDDLMELMFNRKSASEVSPTVEETDDNCDLCS
jgi:hypothetical protein